MPRRRHPFRALFFGLIAGLGVALLLVLYGVLPLGIPTLLVGLLVPAVVGLLYGIGGPTRGKDTGARA